MAEPLCLKAACQGLAREQQETQGEAAVSSCSPRQGGSSDGGQQLPFLTQFVLKAMSWKLTSLPLGPEEHSWEGRT